ncbi:adenosylmethionine--8-amino-7-oxononanoate transaminase [Flavihumibacter petaseus]|uniref:Adenosylmethionine-8-amino-7-oxononanoate aminotransferase n=1 Tax=Flavihumibacter petaseus NBRC 106054 TaxID=1220578 RepID=A0A0E9N1J0_9BACT|nr:adenosylmethionine--8-amino-7-oxononanoate transaminase [Flavihumibacter petaseus]GAO43643.1 adenosylmethionine--8-amino-7-oxononanoate aminotransferase [Flavihumibacter petaseus NBRC 106054]
MDWLSKDKNLIWHPYTQEKTAPPPLFIEKAAGAWLYGADGRGYLDAISSWWVTLHGHAHPYIAERLAAQARKLEQVIFAGFTHQPAIELAEKLIPLLPGHMSRIFYSDNGSTATEVAIKMAIQYWWNRSPDGRPARKKILAFRNAYHGDTFGAMAVSGRSVFTAPFDDYLFETVWIDLPDENTWPVIEQVLTAAGDQLAGFIYEPLLQGAGGMNMYAPAWLDKLLQRLQDLEVICIADEVLTGFGRTGTLFASEQMKAKPDIICLSKGLTGGTMALGVTACTARIFDAYWSDDRKKTLFHGHSFTANPLACTAALASLEIFNQEGTMDRVAQISRWHEQAARELPQMTGNRAQMRQLRQLGTILAFDIVQGESGYLNAIGPHLTHEALQKGLFLRPLGNTLYFMPPYCLKPDEHAMMVEKAVAAMHKVFDAASAL